MSIKDDVKGISKPDWSKAPTPQYSEEEALLLQELYSANQEQLRENARRESEWDSAGKRNLDRLLKTDGAVAKRLAHLFKIHKIEKTSFARQVGMGRSTLHRYLSEDVTDGHKKPVKKKTLLAILAAIPISVADFAYAPSNYAKWEASLNTPTIDGRDILDLRDEVLGAFERNNFIYKHNGVTKRLPYQQYLLMKSILESGFKVLDLVPHDEGLFR